MELIARVIGLSLATGGLGAGLGLALFADRGVPSNSYMLPVFILGCVGGLVGAVAAAAYEIVTALHQAGAECVPPPVHGHDGPASSMSTGGGGR